MAINFLKTKEKTTMRKTTRVPAISLPPAVMRDVRDESKRTGQTITAVVRSRLVNEYEQRTSAGKDA